MHCNFLKGHDATIVRVIIASLFIGACCTGCKENQGKSVTNRERVIDWVNQMPPVYSTSKGRAINVYGSSVEWAKAGRQIEGHEDILLSLLAEKDKRVSEQDIVISLGLTGGEKSCRKLIELLRDRQDEDMRVCIVVALWHIRNKEAVAPLCELAMSTDNDRVLRSAIAALADFDDPHGLEVAEKLLETKSFDDRYKQSVRKHIEQATTTRAK